MTAIYREISKYCKQTTLGAALFLTEFCVIVKPVSEFVCTPEKHRGSHRCDKTVKLVKEFKTQGWFGKLMFGFFSDKQLTCSGTGTYPSFSMFLFAGGILNESFLD